MMINFSIYRYNPDCDIEPVMKKYCLDPAECNGVMLLDALMHLKENQDSTLSFRRSCGEGVCGSDGMNINGKNSLACITTLDSLKGSNIVLRPLPGMPVIRDLIVDMSNFYKQYRSIKPFLCNDDDIINGSEQLQSIKDRKK